MTYWTNDAWRDSYDAWKTRSPDDEYPYECAHECFEIDLAGYAICDECRFEWPASDDEIAARRFEDPAFDREWSAQERRLLRGRRWRKLRALTFPWRWWLNEQRWWPRRISIISGHDELPF